MPSRKPRSPLRERVRPLQAIGAIVALSGLILLGAG
jgi:hypothetical protein